MEEGYFFKDRYEFYEYLLEGKSEWIKLPHSKQDRDHCFKIIDMFLSAVEKYNTCYDPMLAKLLNVQKILTSDLSLMLEVIGRIVPMEIHSKMFYLPDFANSYSGYWESKRYKFFFNGHYLAPSTLMILFTNSDTWFSYRYKLKDEKEMIITLVNDDLKKIKVRLLFCKNNIKLKIRKMKNPIKMVKTGSYEAESFPIIKSSCKTSINIPTKSHFSKTDLFLLSLHSRFSLNDVIIFPEIHKIIFSEPCPYIG